ncbi:alpha-2,8-polysialyltransferase family protein [Octadecabacter sp.]|nr:alpha-2,8-polysialyltransferase family protein [Octadecabacter sp.]
MSKNWLCVIPCLIVCAEIRNKIHPKKSDTLVLYSEYEPLNHYIVEIFKKAKAKVCLIEDGIPSYIQNAYIESDPLTIKQLIYQRLTKYLAKIKNYQVINVRGARHARICDKLIDFVIYYRSISMQRNITQFIAQYPNQILELNSNTALFVNQPIYEGYLSFDKYSEYLVKAVDSLASFEKVYFKFHPREKREIKNKIRSILKHTKQNLIYVNDDDNVEDVARKYKPIVAASFFSSALMSLQAQGVEPVFLYKLFKLDEFGPLENLSLVLNELNYNFPESKLEINKNYVSGLKSISGFKSVSEIIRENTSTKEKTSFGNEAAFD